MSYLCKSTTLYILHGVPKYRNVQKIMMHTKVVTVNTVGCSLCAYIRADPGCI
jgi:hypothetical protein